MDFLQEYGLFLAKTATLAIALLALMAAAMGFAARRRSSGERLTVRRLDERLRGLGDRIEHALASSARARRRLRRARRGERRRAGAKRPRLYVLDFEGDLRASAVDSLREEISAVVMAVRPGDEVLLRLESAGGLVHAYGLAASQLARLRERDIPLTVAVDRIAASGGYLMACVADRVIAAPFAIVGSIGVVAQLPNFHRLLKRHDIDFELHTAGAHKRTLTLFGENTGAARDKFREDLNEIHSQFKEHIARYRPRIVMDRVATGEHWLGERARELDLVDEVRTSDDFLLERRETMELVGLRFQRRQRLRRRLSLVLESLLGRIRA